MVVAGAAVAGVDSGQLPEAGFAHTSLVDVNVERTLGPAPTSSLADVYAWLANTGRAVEPTLAPAPTSSLADVYAWLAETGRTRSARSEVFGGTGPAAVETTYTLQPADHRYRSGWQRNDGPVIFTVTSGTLTFVDDMCRTFDIVAGRTYIGSAGEVIDTVLLPEKNPGVVAVGWFTTRLHPGVAARPVEVEAPCAM
jgi:hypothetical protein